MLTEASTAARKLAQEELTALNKMMNDAGVPHITIPTSRSGAGGLPSEE